MIQDMRAELDSKSADIAEIKDSLVLLKNFLLGAAANQVGVTKPPEHKTGDQDVPSRPLSTETASSKDAGNPSSIGTTLTKVSRSSAPRALSPSGPLEKNLRPSEGGSGSKNPSDVENANDKATIKPPCFGEKQLLGGLPNSESVDGGLTHPRPTDEVSTHSGHWQTKDQNTTNSSYEPNVSVGQPTLTISINGVPRSIPSAAKGSVPSKKPSKPAHTQGLAQPSMVPIQPNGVSAPQNFRGWQAGLHPQPPFMAGHMTLQAPFVGQWQGRKHPGAIGPAPFSSSFGPGPHRQNMRTYGGKNLGSYASTKPRMKPCTYCGDFMHFHKYCPFKLANPNFIGGVNKQIGFHGKDNSKSFGPYGLKEGKRLQPLDRLDKSPSYPIDRQLELIDSIVALVREEDARKAVQVAAQAAARAAAQAGAQDGAEAQTGAQPEVQLGNQIGTPST
ncbi:hypothetical protein TWF481_010071 [Arthrobotrys musiformis]|uniref:Uncharacterized protein n=1 Tax=Arthrobotrys musiformis TaxID=47236 RepID=A0AAV9W0T2_9PEZI